MTKPKILIADPQYDHIQLVPDSLWQELDQKFEVIRNPHRATLSKSQLQELIKDCVGTVAGIEPYDREVLEMSSNLRLISRTGAGLDSIDLAETKQRGISVMDCGAIVTQPVAELTVGLIINLIRHINEQNNFLHDGKWQQIHGSLLSDKTVGIIGLGRIGKLVAKLLQPFGCKIIGCDILPDSEWLATNNVELVNYEQLYSRSDIVTVHVNLTQDNFHLINQSAFTQMKKGVYFLNLSRGPVVDEGALIKLLRAGHFSGVALDVFEHEPYQGELSTFNNVILTPHIGASTTESRKQMEIGALQNLLSFFENEKIKYLVFF